MIVPHMWGELIERRVAQYRYLRQKWKQNLELWTRSEAEIFDPSVSVRKSVLGQSVELPCRQELDTGR